MKSWSCKRRFLPVIINYLSLELSLVSLIRNDSLFNVTIIHCYCRLISCKTERTSSPWRYTFTSPELHRPKQQIIHHPSMGCPLVNKKGNLENHLSHCGIKTVELKKTGFRCQDLETARIFKNIFLCEHLHPQKSTLRMFGMRCL